MKVGFAQLNPTVGDLRGNFEKILQSYERLAAAGAELIITPELAITGYPPQTLSQIALCSGNPRDFGRTSSTCWQSCVAGRLLSIGTKAAVDHFITPPLYSCPESRFAKRTNRFCRLTMFFDEDRISNRPRGSSLSI